MKLIIDIPEEVYHEAKTSGLPCMFDELVATAVSNGTTFDSVIEDIKAEIRQKQWHIGVDSTNQVIEIINKYTGEQNEQS